MSVLQIGRRGGRGAFFEGQSLIRPSSSGSGVVAQSLQERIRGINAGFSAVGSLTRGGGTAPIQGSSAETTKSVEEQLYDALASFKVRTASVAMHMDTEWRNKLFGQLDSLLDSDEWDDSDLPPTLNSFGTFLRMLLKVRPDRRPGLAAASNGTLIATWTVAENKLTIECLSSDEVRWVLSRRLDGETERAAGLTVISRLPEVLSPYNPSTWFSNAVSVPS